MQSNDWMDELCEAVDGAQDRHHRGDPLGARGRLSELQADVEGMIEDSCDQDSQLWHFLIWLMNVRGLLASDVGELEIAEATFQTSLKVSMECERRQEDVDCFADQIVQSTQCLSWCMGWQGRREDAISLLTRVFRSAEAANCARGREEFNVLLSEINSLGEDLGHENLSSKLGLTPAALDDSHGEVLQKRWRQPAPLLGRSYREFERKFDESMTVVSAKDRSSGYAKLEEIRTLNITLNDWVNFSPHSARVARIQIDAYLDEAMLLADLRRFEELYVVWDVLKERMESLLDQKGEMKDLARYFARNVSSVASMVLYQRMNRGENEKFLERVEFARTSAMFANGLLEARRKKYPINAADALAWERITTRLFEVYTTGNSIELVNARKMLQARRLIILDHILDKDPGNDRARSLRSEYEKLYGNARIIRQRIELGSWKWRIRRIV
jgi:hypothetical protein